MQEVQENNNAIQTPKEHIYEIGGPNALKDNRFISVAANLLRNVVSPDLSNKYVNELLQNADDAHATMVNFYTSSNYLVVAHNGRVFNHDDVDALCNAAAETRSKIGDTTQIGYKGIGFKSVFSISDYVFIHSVDRTQPKNEYRFRFDRTFTTVKETKEIKYPWEIVPIWTDETEINKDPELAQVLAQIRKDNSEFTVLFALKIHSINQNQVEFIARTLESINNQLLDFCSNTKNILFLRRVTTINHRQFNQPLNQLDTICRLQKTKDNKAPQPYETYEVESITPKKTQTTSWFLKPFVDVVPSQYQDIHKKYSKNNENGNDNQPVKIILTLAIENGTSARTNDNIYCYFKTQIHAPLNFTFNGDLILDASRSNFQDNDQAKRWNNYLIGRAVLHHVTFLGLLIQENQDKWLFYLDKLMFPQQFNSLTRDYNFSNIINKEFRGLVDLTALVRTLDGKLRTIKGLTIDTFDFVKNFYTTENPILGKYISSEVLDIKRGTNLANVVTNLQLTEQKFTDFSTMLVEHVKNLTLNPTTIVEKHDRVLKYLALSTSLKNYHTQISTLAIFLNQQLAIRIGKNLYAPAIHASLKHFSEQCNLPIVHRSVNDPQVLAYLTNDLKLQPLSFSICFEHLANSESHLIKLTIILFQIFLSNAPNLWDTIREELKTPNKLKVKTLSGAMNKCSETYFPDQSDIYQSMSEIFGQVNFLNNNCVNLSAYGATPANLNDWQKFLLAFGVKKLQINNRDDCIHIFNQAFQNTPNSNQKIKILQLCFLKFSEFFATDPQTISNHINSSLTANEIILFITTLAINPDHITHTQTTILSQIRVVNTFSQTVLANQCYFPALFEPTHILDEYLTHELLHPNYKITPSLAIVKRLLMIMGVQQNLNQTLLLRILSNNLPSKSVLFNNKIKAIKFLIFMFKLVTSSNDPTIAGFAHHLKVSPLWTTENVQRYCNDAARHIYLPDIMNSANGFMLQCVLPGFNYLAAEYAQHLTPQEYTVFGDFIKSNFNVGKDITYENIPNIVACANSSLANSKERITFLQALAKRIYSPVNTHLIAQLSLLGLVCKNGEIHSAKQCYLADAYEPEMPLEQDTTSLNFISESYLENSSEEKKWWHRFFIQIGVATKIDFPRPTQSSTLHYHSPTINSLDQAFLNTRPLQQCTLFPIPFVDQILGSRLFWTLLHDNWQHYKDYENCNLTYYVKIYCEQKLKTSPDQLISPALNTFLGDNKIWQRVVINTQNIKLHPGQYQYFGIKESLSQSECIQLLNHLASKHNNLDALPITLTVGIYQQLLATISDKPPTKTTESVRLLTHAAIGDKYRPADGCHMILSDKILHADLKNQATVFQVPEELRDSSKNRFWQDDMAKLGNFLGVKIIKDQDFELSSFQESEASYIYSNLQTKLACFFVMHCVRRGISDPEAIKNKYTIATGNDNELCKDILFDKLKNLKEYSCTNLYFRLITNHQLKLETGWGIKLEKDGTHLCYVRDKLESRQYKQSLLEFLNIDYFHFDINSAQFEDIWNLNLERVLEQFPMCKILCALPALPTNIVVPNVILNPPLPHGIASPIIAAPAKLTSYDIGKLGEQCVVEMMKQRYQLRFFKVEPLPNGFRASERNGHFKNRKYSQQLTKVFIYQPAETFDIQVTTTDVGITKIKYLEVKSTIGPSFAKFSLTINQLSRLLNRERVDFYLVKSITVDKTLVDFRKLKHITIAQNAPEIIKIKADGIDITHITRNPPTYSSSNLRKFIAQFEKAEFVLREEEDVTSSLSRLTLVGPGL